MIRIETESAACGVLSAAGPFSKASVPPVPMQRACGSARASFRLVGGRSRIGRLHQAGCLKLRFPRLPQAQAEAVLVNTAGGLTGGDRLGQAFDVAAGASLTVTGQACERIYRSLGANAEIETVVRLEDNARFSWLPQETILFDGARLKRSLHLDAAASSRFLLCESVILGREAMGETVRSGLLADRWRIKVDGRLVFADDLKLGGSIATSTARRASLAGNRAFATVLACRPGPETQLPLLRETLDGSGGASAFDGLLVLRLAAPSGLELRRRLIPVLARLAESPLPRLWSL